MSSHLVFDSQSVHETPAVLIHSGSPPANKQSSTDVFLGTKYGGTTLMGLPVERKRNVESVYTVPLIIQWRAASSVREMKTTDAQALEKTAQEPRYRNTVRGDFNTGKFTCLYLVRLASAVVVNSSPGHGSTSRDDCDASCIGVGRKNLTPKAFATPR